MQSIEQSALDQLFSRAHTHWLWKKESVSDDLLHRLYEAMKWGPTSMNGSPARLVFVRSDAAKAKLIPSLMEGNIERTRTAAVTVIVAEDTRWHEQLPRLSPKGEAFRAFMEGNQAVREITGFRNSTLQGAYLMLAARALGLDVGPMSGFDNAKVDAAFFAGTSWRSNFLCNLGYGEEAADYVREARLPFDEVCKIV
jgi:3-hydroxypropanoate dehydrogenase